MMFSTISNRFNIQLNTSQDGLVQLIDLNNELDNELSKNDRLEGLYGIV